MYFLPDYTFISGQFYQIDGKWYYFDEYGTYKMSWYEIDGKWYYFDMKYGENQGVMVTDTYVDGYYIDANGVCENYEGY